MKNPEIAKRIARQSGVSQAEAADRLEAVVHQILTRLREGKETPFGGLGKFMHGPDGRVAFELEAGKPRG
jgi:nucleoid DNA-binding protein